ncbi:DNA polymerase V [Sinobacterium caligoides]|uniref:DNA polymerase V n=1 Tax=Sinobacterium caligoides TaxID=933926 RepID=A0A3N2DDV8_9GAMM|nr:translesion error-prone DNA polymerase V subunit UmuC [Sinobacterium caligoides]ROR97956.1 DNA polymerase V [Sinobacterium caligoides]
MSRVFALVDCNNFYVACEQLFRPDLRHAPVLVLSNNDGCVVSRSKEAKALGIGMAVPVFQLREQIRRHRIVTFSSNYALYADLSARVMQTLEQLAPAVDVYSIDEAFVDLTGVAAVRALEDFGRELRQTVQRCIGLTVCVGIAPSKTLAKLANQAAKQYPATGGVVDLSDPRRRRRLLALMPVGEVWGVGRRLRERLLVEGIETALQLAEADVTDIRQRYSVQLARTVCELNGESCQPLEDLPSPRQQIICSRSFARKISTQAAMKTALCHYLARAAERLRGEALSAKMVTVFMRTSSFGGVGRGYANSASASLSVPSSDTRDLMALTVMLLQRLWRQGYDYSKAGVMLTDLYPQRGQQQDLFVSGSEPQSQALMTTIDRINASGKSRVFFAGQGCDPSWRMRQAHLSPAYTTRWSDLPVVR